MTAPLGRLRVYRLRHRRRRAFDRDDLEQILDFSRQCAEAVDQFRGKTVDLTPVVERRDPSIKPEAHTQIGDITRGDQHWGAERDLRAPFLGSGLVAAPASAGAGLMRTAATASTRICW
jgi:hypothetical protein